MPDIGADRHVVKLVVVPSESEWGSRTDRWQEDLFELRQRVDRAVPGRVEPLKPADGHMGNELAQVVVDLATAGVFAAAFDVIKAWLHEKPGRRAIDAEYEFEENGTIRRGRATIVADNVESNDVAAALDRVFEERE